MILDSEPFFLKGIDKHLQVREFIYNIIASYEDIYMVNHYKNDLVFI